MLFGILLFLLNLVYVLFLIYKTINHINLSHKGQISKEQSSYLITSWIVFL